MADGTVQRIAVIGSPGAGKSTLAATIARATGLPLVHLDREYWRPGWVEPAAAEWQVRNAALVAADRWVIDGNYGSSLPMRLARAELVVWLDLPTLACLRGALARTARFRGQDRPDMSRGCPERVDREFWKFLLYIARFRSAKRPGIERALAASRVRVIQLRSITERTVFAAGLPQSLG